MTINELKAENLRLKAELAGLRGVLNSAGAYLYTKDLQSRYSARQELLVFCASWRPVGADPLVRFSERSAV